MRYLAVGDIHGCFTALRTLAEFVPFNADDALIMLGDYVDRGPDSKAVIDWLLDYQKRGKMIALRGNHEVMMLQARASEAEFERWFQYGGDATLASYAPPDDRGRLADVPESHWKFFDETRAWFETETHFFVHANALPDCPLDEQPDWMLYWEKFGNPPPHQSGKIMVCGHTAQKSGLPLNVGHAVCIDTWIYREGWLTCLDTRSGKYWQANERAETREGRLDEIRSSE